MLAQAEQTTPLWAMIVMPILPWLVLFIFVWLIVRWQSRATARLFEQVRQHMAAVEAKLERLVEAAERRNDG